MESAILGCQNATPRLDIYCKALISVRIRVQISLSAGEGALGTQNLARDETSYLPAI